jgi:hypothetical protein
MGERISGIGTRITAVTTLPLIGLAMGFNQMGQAASKTVQDLQGNKAALDALDPAVKQLGKAYDDMWRLLIPVRAEFQQMAATLMSELVPVLKELMPTIQSVVGWLAKTVKAFADMPLAQQQTILAFVGIAAAVGPVVMGIGQVLYMVGTIQSMAPGLVTALSTIGGGFWAMLGPIGAVAAAIMAVDALMKKLRGDDWFAQGLQAGGQLLVMGERGMVGLMSGGNQAAMNDAALRASHDLGLKGYANGGNFGGGRPILVGERGPEILTPGFSGSVSPMGNNITIIYQPAVALSSRDEAEHVLGPMIANYLHRSGR